MDNTGQIKSILDARDCKISGYLRAREKTHFFYARYPSTHKRKDLIRIHEEGFDNYPLWEPENLDGTFWLERILGCGVHHVNGQKDSFHTYCMPCVEHAADIDRLRADPGGSPLWRFYLDKVEQYARRRSGDAPRLPLKTPGFSLLDCACDICGPERLFVFMYDDQEAVSRLFELITQVYLECIRQLRNTGVRMANPYGFPGVYCNDLLMPNLSPSMIRRYLASCYDEVARECQGLILSINCADAGAAEELLSISGMIGAAFDKRLPLEQIRRFIGKKLFLIHNYIYMDELDGPTLVDGIYCNPIIQTYSKELDEVWRELSSRCGLLVSIHRHTLEQVVETRQSLCGLPMAEDG